MAKKNEFICRENEEIDYLYFFVEGKAKAFNTLSNGKKHSNTDFPLLNVLNAFAFPSTKKYK
jgi:hypothetical protein